MTASPLAERRGRESYFLPFFPPFFLAAFFFFGMRLTPFRVSSAVSPAHAGAKIESHTINIFAVSIALKPRSVNHETLHETLRVAAEFARSIFRIAR